MSPKIKIFNLTLQKLRSWRYAYARFSSKFEKSILTWSMVFDTITLVTSVACIVALIVYMGYNLSAKDVRNVMSILHASQIIFFLNIIFQITFRFKYTASSSRIIKWIVDFMIVLSLVIWVIRDINHPWIPWLKDMLFGHRFFFIALGSYALVDICFALSHIPSRRTNPSLLMALSFIFFILLGSLALMLPRCTLHGISYSDSLFVASSAVCITGLTTVDLPSTFTPMGMFVIAVLVQLGSLGVLTFTSFFALFFTGNTSIYNQLLLKDIIYSKSMNSLIPTLLYVLGFTVVIEAIGAAAVYFTVPDTLVLDTNSKVTFAVFHSMSAFCNAGFSCIPQGMSNPALMQSNQSIYIVTSVLIFAGAVGFPILVNFKEILKFYIRKLFNRIRKVRTESIPLHIYDLNTKIVLYTTTIILVVGSLLFFWLEFDNTLKGMSLYNKIVQSVFNSLVPRSAGFASVNPANFLDVTLLLIIVQMIIGGSSQSMAGGIKVNTFGALMLNLKAILFGHKDTTAFNRVINPASIRRANAVVVIAGLSLTVYCFLILYLEPEIPAKSAIFEVVSAVFTVGSSLGASSQLCDASKVILSTAMLFGRVGLISILSGVVGNHPDRSPHLPIDNVIIN